MSEYIENDGWQPDKSHYGIEEVDAPSEVYVMKGGSPPSSDAVAKAKQKYAEDNDVEFRHLVGRKISKKRRPHGAIVVVIERPSLNANDSL